MKLEQLMTLRFFMVLYALFALNRFKTTDIIQIDGKNTELLVYILFGFFFFKVVYNLLNKEKKVRLTKYESNIAILLFLQLLIAFFGLFNSLQTEQGFYAIAEYFLPTLLVLDYKYHVKSEFTLFVKTMCCIGMIYAVITIVAVSNYSTILTFLSVNADKFTNNNQVRASFMLGSSISISYFLNLVLPLIYYAFFEHIYSSKFMKFLCLATIILISLSIIILQSRLAFVCLLITTIAFLAFYKKNVFSRIKLGIFLIGVLSLAGFLYFKELDFNVLQRVMDVESVTSNKVRFSSAYYGVKSMGANILFGAGMGQTFPRIYEFRELNLSGGQYSLVDPHNTYIMCLNEQGIVGLVFLCFLFYNIYNQVSHICDRYIRFLAKITLIVYLLGALGGSQIFNEISFSIVFWWILGHYMSLARQPKGGISKDESNGNYLS